MKFCFEIFSVDKPERLIDTMSNFVSTSPNTMKAAFSVTLSRRSRRPLTVCLYSSHLLLCICLAKLFSAKLCIFREQFGQPYVSSVALMTCNDFKHLWCNGSTVILRIRWTVRICEAAFEQSSLQVACKFFAGITNDQTCQLSDLRQNCVLAIDFTRLLHIRTNFSPNLCPKFNYVTKLKLNVQVPINFVVVWTNLTFKQVCLMEIFVLVR